MPTHTHRPAKEPPSLLDLYYLHAADFVVSGLALCFSVLFALDFIVDSFTPFATFTRFPWWVSLALWVFLGWGGTFTINGLTWTDPSRVDRGWSRERTGWFLQCAGWVVITISVMVIYPGSPMVWMATTGFAVIGATRIRVLRLIERRARAVQDQLNANRDGVAP